MGVKLSLLVILALCIPSFFRMLRPGMYSTQDFHYFRLVEFDKCVKDFQIPCRWSSDAGLGYGEPLFNFYGQLAYVPAEILHLVGFSYVDSLKLTFIFSLIASAVAMYFLAKRIWRNNTAALISSVLYVYAPYRALDVWVRGALPESISFILFPLILLALYNLIEKQNTKNTVLLSLSLAALVLTHNLSVVLFLPVIIGFVIYKVFQTKSAKFLPSIILSVVFASLLSAFYLLPVIKESVYIDLDSTTRGYFDFRAHFAGTKQILIDRFWGYGASLFGPDDDLSLSVGHFQWIVPLSALVFLAFNKGKSKKIFSHLLFFLSVGWLSLFLTHNKSTPIWEMFEPMKFIQFPWRFLAAAVFCFSLAGGSLTIVSKGMTKVLAISVLVGVIIWNISFFKEDIWSNVSDNELLAKPLWEQQMGASIGDFWPKFGHVIPNKPAPEDTQTYTLLNKRSDRLAFVSKVSDEELELPINYFPGWTTTINGNTQKAIYNENGLITVSAQEGQEINLHFGNTAVRSLGNAISLISLLLMLFLLYAKKYVKK